MSRWSEVARGGADGPGDDYAAAYAERFRLLAAEGADVHGEATFVEELLGPDRRGAAVLDAGCGTGRVGVRLAARGYDVVGCDVDVPMVEVARADAPHLDWRVADLATLDLDRRFDVVLVAGNVVPLLEPGTLAATCERLATHLAPGGRVVCGFGLDDEHLPDGCPVTPLDDVLTAMADAGLVEHERWATWDREPWTSDTGYVVLVTGARDA